MIDPILLPFLSETDEEGSAQILARLIREHAEPRIDSVIRAALPEVSSDGVVGPDDLKGEVVVRLVRRLRELRSDKTKPAFSDFASYVAVTCYNVCWTYLRSRHPERGVLKDRLRYALRHDSDMGLWQGSDGVWLGGRKEWRGRHVPTCPADRIHSLARNITLHGVACAGGSKLNARPLLRAIFDLSGAPVELDDLVELAAELWGIHEVEVINTGTFRECAQAEKSALSAQFLPSPTESGVNLKLLWTELCGLPERQRVVLLLTLHDDKGVDGLTLLRSAGVASMREVSEILRISAVELAAMWKELPYGDSKVAEYLGIKRQQVVNLRKAARERLAYRLRRQR